MRQNPKRFDIGYGYFATYNLICERN